MVRAREQESDNQLVQAPAATQRRGRVRGAKGDVDGAQGTLAGLGILGYKQSHGY
jgi:hypothetical protein